MYSEPLAAHNVPFQSAISQRNLSPITCVLLPVRSLIARVRFKAAPMGRLCESRGPLHIAGYGSADALHREQPSAAFGAGSRECPIPGAIAPALIPNRADRSLRDAQTDGRRLSGCLIALSRICGFTRSPGPLEQVSRGRVGDGGVEDGRFWWSGPRRTPGRTSGCFAFGSIVTVRRSTWIDGWGVGLCFWGSVHCVKGW